MGTFRRSWYPAVLLGVILLSFLLFYTLHRGDNKYSREAAHPSSGGVMRLDMDIYRAEPLVHLVGGWEFYQYKFLAPEEIPGHTPDCILFLGQYGGFELGDMNASPHGEGTYRLTVFTDDIPRDYALELPEIYSAYKVWVNGALKKVEGFSGDGEYAAQTSHSMITFTAAGRIEIVVAARDESHFYSGMVYPPAFGSVEQVLRLLSFRLLVHTAAVGIALTIALLSLFFGYRDRKSAFPILSITCLSFIAYSGYPLVHMLGLRGELWYDLERMAYHALLFSVIWLSGRLGGGPRALYHGMMGIAAVICLSVPVYRHFLMRDAVDMYRYSALLTCWRWLAALYLLLAVGYAVFRRQLRAKGLLAGICVMGTALVADRLLPWFEPVVGGWFGEVAAFILILIIMGALCVDALATYRESRALEERASLDALRLESLRQREQIQREYVEETRKLVHDMRSNLVTQRHYLESGKLEDLGAHIGSLLMETERAAPRQISPHPLLNAVLTDFLDQASADGVPVEYRVEAPEALRISDADLTRLLGNILGNALEACRRMERPTPAWIRLDILYAEGMLEIRCENAFDGFVRTGAGSFLSRKAAGHGYGVRIIREITARLGNPAGFSWNDSAFRVLVRLHLGML